MHSRYFSEKVVEWYLKHQRDLPWRHTKDPYKIWLSEIILQQTRVIQGTPYYLKFIDEFPNVSLLALAPEQKVLRLWQGLGYYTRARNLHKCAKVIVDTYNNKFPESFEKLKTLPGIGEYTAAAIASFAFKEAVAVVDGNVFRVLARIFGTDKPINSPDGKKYFSELANSLISQTNPDLHNQAIMEFGAMYCTPKNPACPGCVFNTVCFAYQHNLQNVLPVKIKLKASRKRYFYYFVMQKGKSLLMTKREGKDIWQGLFDFYLLEKPRAVNVHKLIDEEATLRELNGSILKITAPYKHVLSHQFITARFIIMSVKKNPFLKNSDLKFYPIGEVAELPKPVLISKFLADELLL